MTSYSNPNEWETISNAINKNKRIVYTVMAILMSAVIILSHKTSTEQLQHLDSVATGSELYLKTAEHGINQVLQAALDSLTMLAFISLVIERGLEVFSNTVSGPQKLLLKEQMKHLTQNADLSNPDSLQKLEKVKSALNRHKVSTQRTTQLVAFTVGIVLGLSGIRVLEPLFSLESLHAMPWFQQSLFRIMDITLTGLALAGGSDGIHFISKRIGSHINPETESPDPSSPTSSQPDLHNLSR